MKKYRKNKFFFRTLNTILSGFLAPVLDVNLIVNIITLELKNLRKQHKFYLRFINILLSKFFRAFQSKHNLTGFVFSVKGRLILYNRETRRSVKFITRVGMVYKANMQATLRSYQKETSARYGAMYVSLHFGLSSASIYTNLSSLSYYSTQTTKNLTFVRDSKYDLFFDFNYFDRIGENTIFNFRRHLHNNKTEMQNMFFYLIKQDFNSYTPISRYVFQKYSKFK
jgi:hypothetical protein